MSRFQIFYQQIAGNKLLHWLDFNDVIDINDPKVN